MAKRTPIKKTTPIRKTKPDNNISTPKILAKKTAPTIHTQSKIKTQPKLNQKKIVTPADSSDKKKTINAKKKQRSKTPSPKIVPLRRSTDSKNLNISGEETSDEKKKGKKKVEKSTEVVKQSATIEEKHDHEFSNISLRPPSAKKLYSGVDTKVISQEISKMMNVIDKKIQSSKTTEKKRTHSRSNKNKTTAKSHNYQLHANIKESRTSVVDLFELAKKVEYTNADVLLAIIELSTNKNYYSLNSSEKTNSFWEEVVQYNELKRLFQFFTPKTLKKYTIYISYKDLNLKIAELIKANKKLLDERKTKLLTIITGAQNKLTGNLKDFNDYITNPHKYLNLGLPYEKDMKLTGKKREKETEKVFKGENLTKEIKTFLTKADANSQNILLDEKDEIKKLSYGLRTIQNKENRRLFRFTEEDKFLFSCFDDIVSTLSKEFKSYPKEFIINALKINTLNLINTYEYLKKPHNPQNEKLIFNSSDDHVIKYMANTDFYKEIVDIHGLQSVKDREFFLSQ
jgi:hypothetical protein